MMFNSKLTLRLLLCIYVMCSYSVCAQTIPVEGDTLNYRLVGFVVPEHNKYKNYILEVAEGEIYNRTDFAKKIVLTQSFPANRFIATVPAFGKQYTWRVLYANGKNEVKETGELHHITIGHNIYTDSAKYRLRVLIQDTDHKELYIFNDGTRTLKDLHGNTVWYLPDIPGCVDENTVVRDLKVSVANTITFTTGDALYEITYTGKLLRKQNINQGDSLASRILHQFTRLANGNYMLLAQTTPNVKTRMPEDGLKRNKNAFTETLIEYNRDENVVWWWRSGDYQKLISQNALNDDISKLNSGISCFVFDEKAGRIYVNVKDRNCIMDINYSDKTDVAVYTWRDTNNNRTMRGQNHIACDDEGNIYVYNNNHAAAAQGYNDSTTLLIALKPNRIERSINVLWTYSYPLTDISEKKSLKGGSIIPLQAGYLLADMGSVNRTYIVSPKHEIIWNACYETYTSGNWVPQFNYRISAITGSQLKEIISNTSNNR